MQTVSMQQLWDDFRREMDLPVEGLDIAVSKVLFASGAMAVMAAIARRRLLDMEDATEFALREFGQIRTYARPAYPAASDQ